MVEISDLSGLMGILRSLPLWLFGGITLAGVAIIYAPPVGGIDISGLRKDSGPWVLAGTILSAVLTFARILEWVIRKKTERSKRVEIFVILTKNIHEKLLSYGHLDDPDYVQECVDRLEKSEDGIWVEEEVYRARTVFIEHARTALNVRRKHGDYRGQIERAETGEFLDNSRERLIAALHKKKLPKLFNPYSDEEPTWWQRLWQRRIPPSEWRL